MVWFSSLIFGTNKKRTISNSEVDDNASADLEEHSNPTSMREMGNITSSGIGTKRRRLMPGECSSISSSPATEKATTSASSVVQSTEKYTQSFPLSNDILHDVLGYFVSESVEKVDGQSLRSAMLVCKQWHSIATSRTMWSSNPLLPHSGSDDSIRFALYIQDGASKEKTDNLSSPGSRQPETLSLIGFQKLKFLGKAIAGDQSLLYRSVERSSGERCILSIGPQNKKSAQIINHIFEGDFFHGANRDISWLVDGSSDNGDNSYCMPNKYPRGVALIGRQVVRWYQNAEDINSIYPKPSFQPTLRNIRRGFEEFHKSGSEGVCCNSQDKLMYRLRKCSSLEHLLRLERSNCPTQLKDHISMRHWAVLVDWVVEIVQCFDLEDRIMFQAMDLFRGFVSEIRGNINTSHYQLAVSSCILIASKCHLSSMQVTDLVHCSDNTFSVLDLVATEEIILETLEWKLANSTILDFMYAYAKVWGIKKDSHELCWMQYLSELALQSQIHVSYKKNSIVAAAVVALARFCLPPQAFQDQGHWKPLLWNDYLEQKTGYSLEQVCACAFDLSRCLEQVRRAVPDFAMISRRYRRIQIESFATDESLMPSVSSSAELISYQRTAIAANMVSTSP